MPSFGNIGNMGNIAYKFDKIADNSLKFIKNPVASWLVSILVTTVIVSSLPQTPIVFRDLLNNHVFRFVIFYLALYIETGTGSLSLLVAGGLTFVLYFFGRFKENFELIEPNTDTHPGCVNVKVKDLLDLFEGDYNKLKDAMYSSGVPFNKELTDTNAPEIATYLVNHNHKVNDVCKL